MALPRPLVFSLLLSFRETINCLSVACLLLPAHLLSFTVFPCDTTPTTPTVILGPSARSAKARSFGHGRKLQPMILLIPAFLASVGLVLLDFLPSFPLWGGRPNTHKWPSPTTFPWGISNCLHPPRPLLILSYILPSPLACPCEFQLGRHS